MNTPVFLDTSGLIALTDKDDYWHSEAVEAWSKVISQGRSMVTSSVVLIELADGLCKVRFRSVALQLVDALNSSKSVDVVHVSPKLDSEGWDLYRKLFWVSRNWKHVMHLIRLLLSGNHVLREGTISVDAGEYRERLLTIKRGEMPFAHADDWRKELQRKFEAAFRTTTLPERPDYERAKPVLDRCSTTSTAS